MDFNIIIFILIQIWIRIIMIIYIAIKFYKYLKNSFKIKVITYNIFNDLFYQISLLFNNLIILGYFLNKYKISFSILPLIIYNLINSIIIFFTKKWKWKFIVLNFIYILLNSLFYIQILLIFLKIDKIINFKWKKIITILIILNAMWFLFFLYVTIFILVFICQIKKIKKLDKLIMNQIISYIFIWLNILGVFIFIIIILNYFNHLSDNFSNIIKTKIKHYSPLIFVISYMIFLWFYLIIFKKRIIEFLTDFDSQNEVNKNPKKKFSFYFFRITNNLFRKISQIDINLLKKIYWKKSNKIKNWNNNEILISETDNKETTIKTDLNEIKINEINNLSNLNILIEDIKKCENIKSDDNCFICLKNINDSLFYPCKHGGFCFNCGKKTIDLRPNCMICKKIIKNLLKIEFINNNLYKVKEIVYLI